MHVTYVLVTNVTSDSKYLKSLPSSIRRLGVNQQSTHITLQKTWIVFAIKFVEILSGKQTFFPCIIIDDTILKMGFIIQMPVLHLKGTDINVSVSFL